MTVYFRLGKRGIILIGNPSFSQVTLYCVKLDHAFSTMKAGVIDTHRLTPHGSCPHEEAEGMSDCM